MLKNIVFTFFLILLIGSSITIAQSRRSGYVPPKGSPAIRAFEEGIRFYNTKQLIPAIRSFRKATQLFTQYVNAYDHLGLCYLYVAKTDSAAYFLKKSLTIDPKGVYARQHLGTLYRSRKEYHKALTVYKEMIALNKFHPEGFWGAARVQFITGDYAPAAQHAMKAMELYRKDNHAYQYDAALMLGIIYYYMEDKTKARNYLLKARKGGKKVPSEMVGELGI